MTEYDNPQDAAQTQGSGGANPGVDMIDVLIRNLETAKANFTKTNFEGGKELAAGGPVFCTLLYAEPGVFCPLGYFHGLAETAPVE